MPHGGIEPHRSEDTLNYEEIRTFVEGLRRYFDLEKVRITGGEPLLRRDIDRLIAMISRLGIPDIAMTTNGQLLAGQAPALRGSGLSRVNISLDSLDSERFRHLTRGGVLSLTLSGIEAALGCDLKPVKLNMVVMRGINDSEVVDMLSFAMERGCQMRFLELMPIGNARNRFDRLFVSSGEVRANLEKVFAVEPLTPVAGITSKDCIVRDRSGRTAIVGFISPYSSPFCQDCRRLRLTADGYLMGCLAQENKINIRSLLDLHNMQARGGLKRAVESALTQKRNGHAFENQQPMVSVGG
jgi:cyclic pyranopterin phosphate synthase